jgi:tetratricopeptide (TPR) repeat protein
MYLYIQFRCRSNKGYLITAFGSSIAAMFCKEFVVTLPIMLLLYEFYFLDGMVEPWTKRCGRVLPFFFIALIVPILLFNTPPDAIGVASIADSDSLSHVDITRARGGVSRHEYFLTELNVVRTYVRLLFFPVHQNLDYDYPLSQGISGSLLSGLFLLFLLALSVITYRSCRVISFGIAWFFIALSVESSFIPIGHVIAEYRLYLASVGFAFLIMNLIYMQPASRRKLDMIAAGIIIILSIFTFQRNKVWKDEITLWGDTVQKSPHKARAHYCLGYAYFNKGDFNKALPDFNEAINIKPDYIEALINRGIIYFEESKLSQALADYNKVIKMDDNVAEAYYNRGDVYLKLNDLALAKNDYNLAVKLNPKYAEAYTNLGSIYVKQGNFGQALSEYNKAIEIYPRGIFTEDFHVWLEGIKKSSIGFLTKSHYNSYADAYYNRGCVFDRLGNLPQALSDYTMAVEINPDHADAYNNRGYIFNREGNFIQAIADFNRAIEINSNMAGYYYNRGIPETKLGNIQGAIVDFSRAIELNPYYGDAYYNRSILLYGTKEYPQAMADVQSAKKWGAAVNPEYLNALYKMLK